MAYQPKHFPSSLHTTKLIHLNPFLSNRWWLVVFANDILLRPGSDCDEEYSCHIYSLIIYSIKVDGKSLIHAIRVRGWRSRTPRSSDSLDAFDWWNLSPDPYSEIAPQVGSHPSLLLRRNRRCRALPASWCYRPWVCCCTAAIAQLLLRPCLQANRRTRPALPLA